MHEAYYYGGNEPIVFISKVPNNSFIGEAPINMGSSEGINYNDYRMDNVENLFNENSIRDLYYGNGHGEVLLYRAGLKISAVGMKSDIPTSKEVSLAKEIEAKMKEVYRRRPRSSTCKNPECKKQSFTIYR